jgi:hypothetical protein
VADTFRTAALAGALSLSAAGAAAADPTRLPIGDGHVSRAPERGAVWSCETRFGGGGARAGGAWLHEDGTFDVTAKPVVAGAIAWPSSFAIVRDGATRRLTGNGLPGKPTGIFPISRDDPAYRYDTNPNAIAERRVNIGLPALPVLAAQPSCLPLGPIGVLLSGAVIFNALDAAGRDAVAHEMQDRCQGHPEAHGIYHYHNLSACLDDADRGTGHSVLVGYAFDGFGIFGRRGEDGVILTNADLDECHGHTHEIDWDGEKRVVYHYHATLEYPYTIGCYRGTPAVARPGR